MNSMEGAIRVLLVDDHHMARESLRRVLAVERDIQVVAEASDGLEALAKIQSLGPDVVLMDLRMPNMGGLDALQALKRMNLTRKVIVFSFYEEYLARAIDAGVGGYLLKDVPRGEVPNAIRRVYRGELVLGSTIRSGPQATASVLQRLQGIGRVRPVSPEHRVEAELLIQAPVEPTQLLEFMAGLRRDLEAEIAEMAPLPGDRGIRLRLMLPLRAPVKDTLSELPQVESLLEEQPTGGFHQEGYGALGRDAGLRFRVALKCSSADTGRRDAGPLAGQPGASG
ncbi:MAG: response regulator transcription factor [Chloroflexi bacterium]|nr:response regulator transcription factor [Chloroflexota bacterium]